MVNHSLSAMQIPINFCHLLHHLSLEDFKLWVSQNSIFLHVPCDFTCAFHSNFDCLEKPSPLGYPYVKWTETRKALKNEHSKLLLVCFWTIGLFFQPGGRFSVVRLFAPFSAPFVADVIAACDIHGGGPWSASSKDRMPCTTSFVEWWSVRWRD